MQAANSRSHQSYLGLHVLLIVACSIVMLGPFIFMLIVSLWPKEAFMSRTFPLSEITINNYFEVFRQIPFGRFYLNSIIVSVGTVTLQILMASLAAFAFARLRFKGRETLFCSTWRP